MKMLLYEKCMKGIVFTCCRLRIVTPIRSDGAESEDNMEDKKEFYKKLLVGMSDQMADILANGKAIEIDHSRSGLKMYSFRRRHEIVQRQQNEATPDRK